MKLDNKTLKNYLLIDLVIMCIANELFDVYLLGLLINIPMTLLFFGLIFIKIKNKIELEVNPFIHAIFISLLLCSLCNDLIFSHLYFKINIWFVILEYLFFLTPMILMCIFKKPKIGFIVVSSLYFIFSFIQKYIIQFRGYIFTINDLTKNMKSAIAIRSKYSIDITYREILYIVYFIILITYICIFNYKQVKYRFAALTSILLGLSIVLGFNQINKTTLKDMIYYGATWGEDSTGAICVVGLINQFYSDALYNKITDPIDYSDQKAKELLNYDVEEYKDNQVTIIAIKSESLSDINYLYDIGVDYMPFWNSVEAVKGYVTVPVYGGMTCNAEYEFLTGNSCYFLNHAGIFTNYLDSNTSSIVSYMDNLGFNTYCYAPIVPSLWNYKDAYKYLGFQNTYFVDSIKPTDEECLDSTNYMLDKALYDRVIKDVDNRDKSKSNFYYINTVQNHAPYENYNKYFTIKDKNLEPYINLIYESDLALEHLINHYKDEDNVIIVLFGDHYPALTYNFKNNGIEDYAKMHQTPFIIWKKGIQNEFIDKISLNYLSNELFKVADIPLTPMQQYLEKFRQEIPIISSFGYYDTEWHKDKNQFNDYHIIQWYNMFSKAI